jgi:hypothetical protein
MMKPKLRCRGEGESMSKWFAMAFYAEVEKRGSREGSPATETTALRSFGGGDPNGDGGVYGWTWARV